VKIGLNKGRRTSWNTRCRVNRGVCIGRGVVVKNGQIEKVNVTATRGQSADPCPCSIKYMISGDKGLTIVVSSLVGIELNEVMWVTQRW